MRKRWKFAAVAALLATPAMAQAQNSAGCLSQAEANALFVFALPEMLNSVDEKCAPHLPRSAFLVAQGPQLVARQRAATAANWPTAKAAFIKMATAEDTKGDTAKIMTKIPDETLRTLVVTGLGVAVTSDIKPADCPKASRLVEALAPLPVANLATIVVETMGLAGGKDKKPPIAVCEAP